MEARSRTRATRLRGPGGAAADAGGELLLQLRGVAVLVCAGRAAKGGRSQDPIDSVCPMEAQSEALGPGARSEASSGPPSLHTWRAGSPTNRRDQSADIAHRREGKDVTWEPAE